MRYEKGGDRVEIHYDDSDHSEDFSGRGGTNDGEGLEDSSQIAGNTSRIPFHRERAHVCLIHRFLLGTADAHGGQSGIG